MKCRVAAGNQLRAELERFWPGPIGLFTDLDSSISLAFLERYPSPADARGAGREASSRRSLSASITAALQKPARLLAKFCRAPEGRVGEVEMNARRQIVLCLVQTLRTARRAHQERSSDRSRLGPHPSRRRDFTSLFKDPSSFLTAAEMLAEIGDSRDRYPARDALAGDAGQAAVAIESGKRKTARFRWGCNKRLRSSFSRLADTTRRFYPRAQDLYAPARARGHDHPRALRTLGRAWCRIVWRCWQDGVPYDPARHRALQRHITVTIPTPSGPVPDTAATQRMPGDAVTQGRPAGPSAQRLMTSRHPLSHTKVDTGRLLSEFVGPRAELSDRSFASRRHRLGLRVCSSERRGGRRHLGERELLRYGGPGGVRWLVGRVPRSGKRARPDGGSDAAGGTNPQDGDGAMALDLAFEPVGVSHQRGFQLLCSGGIGVKRDEHDANDNLAICVILEPGGLGGSTAAPSARIPLAVRQLRVLSSAAIILRSAGESWKRRAT